MDISLWIIVAVGVALAVVAFRRTGEIPWQGALSGGKLLWSILPRLLIGFLIAGLIPYAIPEAAIGRWMGGDSGWRGILVGWVLGSFLPGGGPFIVFPLVAGLMKAGAGVGAMVAFMSAKDVFGPVRVLTWEIPILGGRFFIIRFLSTTLFPPIAGFLAQMLASPHLFGAPRPPI